MQDGSFHKTSKGVTLCTDSFTKEDVLLLSSVLQLKFKLKCTIQKAPNNKLNIYKGENSSKVAFSPNGVNTLKGVNRSRIYISAKSLPLLRELVKNYFNPSMYYKLGL